MLPLLQQEPVWKKTVDYRLGPQYRSNEGRLIYVEALGWFIRLRGEFNSIPGLTTSHGIAGPFHTQELAFAYLRHSIQRELSRAGH
jgi:hypothetical protein